MKGSPGGTTGPVRYRQETLVYLLFLQEHIKDHHHHHHHHLAA
jgi:hypothetical protein